MDSTEVMRAIGRAVDRGEVLPGVLDVLTAADVLGFTYGSATAAGSLQADATPLTDPLTIVGGADSAKGVRLPPATLGSLYFIANNETLNRALVYPDVGDAISCSALGDNGANNPVNVGGNALAIFVCLEAGRWYAILGVEWYGNNSDWNIGAGLLTAGGLNIGLQTLPAAGTTQTDAALVVPGTVNVTGASGTNGVKLPTVATGLVIPIYNSDASNALLLYPTAGGSVTINGGSANAAITVPAKTLVVCVCTSTTNWAVMVINTVAAADTIAEVTPDAGVTVDGTLLKDGGLTATAGATIKTNVLAEVTTGQGIAVPNSLQVHINTTVAATSDGATTGLIPAGVSQINVTCDDAAKKISLPAGTIGDVIKITMGGTACKLIAVTASDKVNNVTVGATNQLTLLANATYTCKYVAANDWRVTGNMLNGSPIGISTAGLTTLTMADAAGSPTYSLGALTAVAPVGFASVQDGVDALYALKQLQIQMAELLAATGLTPVAI